MAQLMIMNMAYIADLTVFKIKIFDFFFFKSKIKNLQDISH